MLEKIQLLKEWIATGQIVAKFRNRSEDDLTTLVNQMEIEAKKLPQVAVSGSLPLPEFQDWITEFNWKKYKDLDRWVCLGGRDNLNPKTTNELIEIFNKHRQ